MSDINTNTKQESNLEVETKNNTPKVAVEQIEQMNQDEFKHLKLVLEAILMAEVNPISVKKITDILEQHNTNQYTRVKDKVKFDKKHILLALDELSTDLDNRAIELKNLNSNYRIQTKPDYAVFVQYLWQEKPARYSKATLETLAIIAYRQPVTRGEIEHIRGVTVSSQIIRNLQDREWIKVVGHKEVPGKPAIYATTQDFLHDLNLGKLDELPALADIKDIKDKLSEGSSTDTEQETVETNKTEELQQAELSLKEELNEQ